MSSASGLGTQLSSVQVLDRQTLMVHFRDGQVVRRDDGTGNCAFRGHCHSVDGSSAQWFGTPLDTNVASQTSTWTLRSNDAAAYPPTGRSPVAVHRKSKLNGMTLTGWDSSIWDDTYEVTREHFIYLRLPDPLEQGRTYTLDIAPTTHSDQTSFTWTFDLFQSRSEAIHINLAGVEASPDAVKAADLYHWMGDGGHRDYSSFVGNQVYLYSVQTGEIHPVGTVSFRGGDANDWYLKSPVWTADYSGFSTPGLYRLVIDVVGASQDFTISSDAFREPFRVSTLGFFLHAGRTK